MLFGRVVEISRRVAQTSRRLEKIELIAGLLRLAAPDEIETVVAFLSGYSRQGKIGVGYRTLENLGATPADTAELALADVDTALSEMARAEPKPRRELLERLMTRATAPEQSFLKALLVGEIRQGALEGVMLEALAKASGTRPERVRRAAMMAGDVTLVARPAMEAGEAGLARFDIQPMRPVQPMLAQTAEDPAQAIAELGRAAFEYKFDGARVQMHRAGGEVRIFSRALNDVTAAAPEIVEAARALPGGDLILDGEALCLGPDARPQPFQVTARRFGRKLDLVRMRAELPLSPFWFDLLYADGQSMLDEPQHGRFEALARLAPAGALVPHLVTANEEEAAEFIRGALDHGHEGVMAKSLEAVYAAGARGQSWLKIKPAHTLDLAILAAEWGSGRRKGWLSNLHLGARDTEKGGFAMLGKTFKGLTDEMLVWQTAELLKAEIGRDAYTVYVEPRLVAEIAFNEIQVSPRYSSGMALRFARVKRYRQDKSAGEADTVDTVRKLAAGGRPSQ
jgi:DNA ligase-1